MELIMNTDLAKELPQVIDFNYEQLKSELAASLESYNNLVVTEDSIKSAKTDRAKLNKLKDALNDKKIEVKKECLKPFEDFETKVKELMSMVDAPIQAIDGQIKTFENIQKQNKQQAIEVFYTANIGDLEELLPLDKIFNPKWLNVSAKMIEVTKEIMDTITKVKNDIGILKAMKLECESQVIDAYLKDLDMSVALAEKNRFEEQQKKIKEYQKKQEPEEPNTIVVDGTPGHDLCDAKPGDRVVFAKASETANDLKSHAKAYESNNEFMEDVHPEELKTIKVIFKDTTQAFRLEMRALTQKHNITYGGLK